MPVIIIAIAASGKTKTVCEILIPKARVTTTIAKARCEEITRVFLVRLPAFTAKGEMPAFSSR